ncbi:hypothetical protein BS50DRAFT_579738 [Corynespora cassiicola Philippines]|uniref:Uncharacterized protein n=1 Tax=Corynespora cassiicola Philippines TaxID=1448308 RepID=A0A2T2N3W1_CORCC|nr:hypothetical protein BS50DRAFT_579738 [Corynespora cassiicola Philippines]
MLTASGPASPSLEPHHDAGAPNRRRIHSSHSKVPSQQHRSPLASPTARTPNAKKKRRTLGRPFSPTTSTQTHPSNPISALLPVTTEAPDERNPNMRTSPTGHGVRQTKRRAATRRPPIPSQPSRSPASQPARPSLHPTPSKP